MENGSEDIQPENVQVDETKGRSETVDLASDDSVLKIDISDALSEPEKVKYTVNTKTNLSEFSKPKLTVMREHEDFVWLHSAIEENEAYAGYIIPPAPPKPDFDASREKLQRLSEGEQTMTKEEVMNMKDELEAEYLANFKKTVAMHEIFLNRIAKHPVFRADLNFRVFLEYEHELEVRGKNKKEKLEGFWKSFSKSADKGILSGQKDIDDFFEHEKAYQAEYHSHIKDAVAKSDRLSRMLLQVGSSFNKGSLVFENIATSEKDDTLHKVFMKSVDIWKKLKKLENRVSSDTDLKLTDVMRYYLRDTEAAEDLLYRRLRSLADYEAANKHLERARAKNKDVPIAENAQKEACEKFEKMSDIARSELKDLKIRRVEAFKKSFVELADLQMKHANAQVTFLQATINDLKKL